VLQILEPENFVVIDTFLIVLVATSLRAIPRFNVKLDICFVIHTFISVNHSCLSCLTDAKYSLAFSNSKEKKMLNVALHRRESNRVIIIVSIKLSVSTKIARSGDPGI
jgi:hypothetical protein